MSEPPVRPHDSCPNPTAKHRHHGHQYLPSHLPCRPQPSTNASSWCVLQAAALCYVPATRNYWVTGQHGNVQAFDPRAPGDVTPFIKATRSGFPHTPSNSWLLCIWVCHPKQTQMLGLEKQMHTISWWCCCYGSWLQQKKTA